ncbi:carbonate dehydratase [Endozoicomonas sp. (ex Bugula neritina AB1)]|nr:carbonate dehydratase [Endozoicomonas sp. (ex Bugula neritina AB1)]
MSSVRPCFHCSLPAPDPVVYFAKVEGVEQPMCCPGCKAVTEAIVAGGLDNYYHHRTEPSLQAFTVSQTLRDELSVYDREDIQADFVQVLDDTLNDKIQNDSTHRASLLIGGITCAACVWLLEKHIGSMPGVERVIVNLSTHEAQITWHSQQTLLSTLLMEIHRIGYKAFPWRADRQEALLKNENRQSIRRLAVAGIGTMQVMMYAIALYSGAISNDMASMYRDLIRIMSAVIATPIVLYAAAPFFKASIRDIKVKHLGMDVPVSIAIGGAYVASLWATFNGSGEVYFDSVSMFTFFLLTGRYLELRARHSTARSAMAINNLLPVSCLKRINGQYTRVPAADLQPNDQVRILPGDSIPADGTLLSGNTSVNESMLTGEYMPIEKTPGDALLCGSINTDNAVEMIITHVGQETRMAGIVSLLQRAQQDKPAIAKIADKIAGWFVAAVLLVAFGVYHIWSAIAPDDAFWITLSVLVVTCPCALSLATPAALTAATGYLHKLGLLITQGHVLEGMTNIDHIVFDKTGTLTHGELSLAEIIPLPGITQSSEALLDIASALEAHSEHPIAKAFTSIHPLSAENVISHTGMGLEGKVEGCHYRLGRPDFAFSKHPPETPLASGQWLLLADNNHPLCWFRINDSLRPEAASTVAQLKAMGIKVSLLSGDAHSVVEATAKTAGIDHWHATASPDHKLNFIQHCQQQGETVMMLGDGINDVPVLAGADISLAMGNSSDLARTSADAVLISSNLKRLPDALHLAKKTRRIIHQNLGWALGYNLIALPLASMGMIAPWMAAIGMALSSLIVVGNALRLNRRNTLQQKPSQPKTSPRNTTSTGRVASSWKV